MEFRILGPLEAGEDGRRLDLGGHKPRTLLAVLLLSPDQVVSADRLVDELWGGTPPRSAQHLLHVYVSSLRKVIGPRLVTRAPGYVLELERDELDADRFEHLLAAARRSRALDAPGEAVDLLSDALGLWRGPALADFAYEPFAQAEISRLEELRLTAREDRVDAELALGRHGDVIGELEALIAENPLRGSPRERLMLALYRAGRQADALDLYRETRRVLRDELGLEPSRSLQRLERAILRHAPELEAEPPGEPTAAHPSLKLVTIVVADVGDADELDGLDAERRHAAAGTALRAIEAALLRHDGSVQRLPGETLLATFGVNAAHEDDALRAVRAADEALECGMAPRVGIEAGEIVIEGGSVAGEASSRAMRLSRAAKPGEILLGETVQRLVSHAVLSESEPRPGGGRRLIAVRAEAPAVPRELDSPLVGRNAELARLEAVLDAAVRTSSLQVVAVVGDAGVGKSRLAQESARLQDERATVLVGRCVEYGEESGYRPLAEIVRQAGGETVDDLRRLAARLPEAPRVADHVAAALDPAGRGVSRAETFWALRRFLEALAADRPLLVVLEDLHWAQPTLLDFVEHLRDRSKAAPIVLLGLARPELLEQRPDWPGRRANASRLELERLSPDESADLLERLLKGRQLSADARARLIEAAEGNPLFLEQLLAMLGEPERGFDRQGLPPTIRAVLAARLDRLGPAERAVLERAAVVGRHFELEAVTALLPESAHPSLERHLVALSRKGYIVAGRPPGFRHALIRDAAYRALPRTVRADLHEHLAGWLEDEAAEPAERIGYHLEQAFRYREEVGALDWHARRLGSRASAQLGTAGRRALRRDDVHAAADLLGRAASLLREDDHARLELLPDLVGALRETADLERAADLAVDAAARAAGAGDRALEAKARVEHGHVRLMIDRDGAVETAFAEGRRAAAVFDELGDDEEIARALLLVAVAHRLRGEQSARRAVLEQALEHAARGGDLRLEGRIRDSLGGVHNYGPSTVEDLLAYGESSLAWAREHDDRLQTADALAHGFARPLAMLGEFDAARARVAEARAIAEDLGLVMYLAGVASAAGFVEMLAGKAVASERELRAGYELVKESGMQGSYFAMAVRDELAQALCALGRYEEAKELSEESERLAAQDDVQAQVMWRCVRAKAIAREGKFEEAEALAREAVELAAATELVLVNAAALGDLAEFLVLAGRGAEALAPLGDAHRLYEAKGDRVSAKRTETALAQLETALEHA